MSSAGAGAGASRASELVEFHVSLIIRAKAPQPQDTGLLAQHAFHHQCGLIAEAVPEGGVGEFRQLQLVLRPHGRCPGGGRQLLPRVEGHLKWAGGRGCIGGSGLQPTTARGDPKHTILPGWFLLSCTKKKGSDKPLGCTSGTASNPGQGNQELGDRQTPEVTGATSPREPVYLDRTQWSLLRMLSPIKQQQHMGGASIPISIVQ